MAGDRAGSALDTKTQAHTDNVIQTPDHHPNLRLVVSVQAHYRYDRRDGFSRSDQKAAVHLVYHSPLKNFLKNIFTHFLKSVYLE